MQSAENSQKRTRFLRLAIHRDLIGSVKLAPMPVVVPLKLCSSEHRAQVEPNVNPYRRLSNPRDSRTYSPEDTYELE